MSERTSKPTKTLLILALAYGAASLFHHIHNAEFLDEYPGLPGWLSRGRVYAAWLGVTAVGLTGYALLRSRHRIAGLAVLGIYAAFGLDGLGHYAIAPLSAHTVTMHLTIGLEVATALLLITAVASGIVRELRGERQSFQIDS